MTRRHVGLVSVVALTSFLLSACGEPADESGGLLGAGQWDAGAEVSDALPSVPPSSAADQDAASRSRDAGSSAPHTDAGDSDAAQGAVGRDGGTHTASDAATTSDAATPVSDGCPPLTDFPAPSSRPVTEFCEERNAALDPDAGVGLVCTDLEPMQGERDLIIAQVHLEHDAVEFFNPTDRPIPLDGYVLSQPPHCVTIAGTGITVQPNAYALLEHLGPVDFDREQPGEVSLYTEATLDDRTAMLDFVCWNGDSPMSHRQVAETTSNGIRLWYDECPVPENGILQRVHFSHGFFGEDYWTDDWVVWTCPVCSD